MSDQTLDSLVQTYNVQVHNIPARISSSTARLQGAAGARPLPSSPSFSGNIRCLHSRTQVLRNPAHLPAFYLAPVVSVPQAFPKAVLVFGMTNLCNGEDQLRQQADKRIEGS